MLFEIMWYLMENVLGMFWKNKPQQNKSDFKHLW